MKKAFVLLSTLIAAMFFIWELVQRSDEFLFDMTNNVILEEGSKSITKEKFDQSLNNLALKHHSLVVNRIVVPKKNNQSFVYQKFGNGELTKGFKEATEAEQKATSVISQYRIISGGLTDAQLADHFTKLGYKAKILPKRGMFLTAASFLFSNSLLLSLLVFILTFAALTIILRIKDLRSAGIRLISGESIWSIMSADVKSDALFITASFLIGNGLGLIVFLMKGLLHLPIWRILLGALMIYDGMLLLISFLLSFIYLVGLRKKDLISIIKGKLPVGRLIGMMLFCQLLAVIIVGYGVSMVPVYYSEMQEMKRAADEWDRLDSRVNLMTGLASGSHEQKTMENDVEKWYQLLDDAINNHDAIVVENNFQIYVGHFEHPRGITIDSYDPEGNTLYVTPNYLKFANIKLDSQTQNKINHLKLGEFGLVLPEKLKSDTRKYQQMYEKNFASMTDKTVKSSSIISYVDNQKERFIFNNIGIKPQQFLKDPIIVVVTPRSTGNNFNSKIFWRNLSASYTFFKGYDQTKNLLKKYHLYDQIAEITNSQQSYERQIQFFRNQTITFFVNSILAIITSAILFNSMNLLYFEEFRKDIFIKRISGMKFFELHRNYLIIQFVILIIGLGISLFGTQNIVTNVLTLAIFGANLFISLTNQIKKEDEFSVTVLKGM
ncbi:DUF1430 domain-containing protein [Xylocopilactobacillus apis]|uniref:Bacteriocin-associated integral membrane protein n=1 Tax=Xylocopilactobacillus apis TaxID=2932183 RepID=A0AAU9D441_9LACO|nr:DUF1430 domain-containing protein [Xylocopilactobacillus apis]BDR55607.1 hypothetical protein KIMC2_01690 [Xylocopilactobacillus apis]